MIPRLKAHLGLRELAAAFTPPRRDDVERFEQQFAAEMGQAHAVAFPYGRTGLSLLLRAMGIQGREIICPAYSCVVVPHAIVTSGNEPVFVDSCDSDFNMNLDLVERAITPQTAAIVATSIFGYPVDLDRLADIRRRHPNVAIIQDCAHSFQAEWQGRPVQQAGAAAIFGLNISKLMTSIFGGMVTTDSDTLHDALLRERDRSVQPAGWTKSCMRRAYLLATYPAFSPPIYGLVNWLERSGFLDRFVRYYDESVIEMPADSLIGMTAVEARVGQVQLKKLQTILAHRRKIAGIYHEQIEGITGLRRPPLVEGATYSHYVPRVTQPDALCAELLPHGVQLGRLIEYSIPDMKAYRFRPGTREDCPVSRAMAASTINLPLHTSVKGATRIVQLLKRHLPSEAQHMPIDRAA
jgi:dTDP-4-amino-4,6-dideoxygalactose transaminase